MFFLEGKGEWAGQSARLHIAVLFVRYGCFAFGCEILFITESSFAGTWPNQHQHNISRSRNGT